MAPPAGYGTRVDRSRNGARVDQPAGTGPNQEGRGKQMQRRTVSPGYSPGDETVPF